MKSAMTATLLQLGDSTSRNLEFSHRRDVWVSYGEETITESNRLEIRRRHPELVSMANEKGHGRTSMSPSDSSITLKNHASARE